MPRRWKYAIAFGLAGLAALPQTGLAASLAKAVEAALLNDPVFLAAAEQRNADAEALPKARAELLPRLVYQAAKSSNVSDQYAFSPNGSKSPTTTSNYDSETKNLTLTQPLLRPRSWMGYMQGVATVDAAEATYEAARQVAIDRLVGAFAEKLRLEAELAAERETVAALDLKLKSVRGLYRAEKSSLVDMRQAESNLLQGRAKEAETSANLDTANRELARLTRFDWGMPLAAGRDWKAAAAAIIAVVEDRLAKASELDVENHPGVVSLRLRHEAADWEVRKRRSDHSPTVDLVASHVEGTSASDVTIGRFSRTKSIGLQLTVPLFSGGSVTSSVREGIALRDKSSHELDNMRMTVANDRKRTLSQLRVSLMSLKAGLDTVEADALAVRQTRLGVAAGLSSDVDVREMVARQARSHASLLTALAKALSLYSQYRLALGALDAADLKELSEIIGG